MKKIMFVFLIAKNILILHLYANIANMAIYSLMKIQLVFPFYHKLEKVKVMTKEMEKEMEKEMAKETAKETAKEMAKKTVKEMAKETAKVMEKEMVKVMEKEMAMEVRMTQ